MAALAFVSLLLCREFFCSHRKLRIMNRARADSTGNFLQRTATRNRTEWNGNGLWPSSAQGSKRISQLEWN